jgi:hypothetical protein
MTKSQAGIGIALLAGLLTAAGCGSSPSTPSWASALGPGVTVQSPAQPAPGHGSPAALVAGIFSAVASKHYPAECSYVEPSQQSGCASGVGALTSSTAPYSQNAAIGYVVIHGDEALVGSTGKFCVPGQKPECYTNNDPAAIFASNKKSFSALWTEQNNVSSENVYSLAPCIKINGKWYLYVAGS